MPTTKRVKQATQFRLDDVTIGVMRTGMKDDVPTARLLVTVADDSRIVDLHVADELALDAHRNLTLDAIDLTSEPNAVQVTVRTSD